MKETKIKFGLWHKKEKKLLKFSVSSTEGADFCGETATKLDLFGDKDWLVDSSINAEYVRNFSTRWYNADYETPTNNFDSNELIVVEVRVETEIKSLDIKVPTVKEFLIEKYEKSEPGHLEYLLQEIDDGREMSYSYYDLEMLIEDRKHNKK